MHRAAAKGREKALRLLISKVKVGWFMDHVPHTPARPYASLICNGTPHGRRDLLKIVCDVRCIHVVEHE